MPEFILNAAGKSRTTGTADPVITGPSDRAGPMSDVPKLAPVLGGDLDAAGFAVITPDIESASGVTAIDISPEGNASYKLTYTIDTAFTNFSTLLGGGPNGFGLISRVDAGAAFPAFNFQASATLTNTGGLAQWGHAGNLDAMTLTKEGLLTTDAGFSGPVYNGNHYGGLYAATNVTADTISATPARVVNGWESNNPSNLIVPAHGSGTLTVPAGGGGTYRVECYFGWAGTASKVFLFKLYKNTGTMFGQAAGATGVSGLPTSQLVVNLNGTIALAAGDVVSLYAESSDGATSFILAYGELYMERIGA